MSVYLKHVFRLFAWNFSLFESLRLSVVDNLTVFRPHLTYYHTFRTVHISSFLNNPTIITIFLIVFDGNALLGYLHGPLCVARRRVPLRYRAGVGVLRHRCGSQWRRRDARTIEWADVRRREWVATVMERRYWGFGQAWDVAVIDTVKIMV